MKGYSYTLNSTWQSQLIRDLRKDGHFILKKGCNITPDGLLMELVEHMTSRHPDKAIQKRNCRIVMLFYGTDLTAEEIGQVFDISGGTVQEIYRRFRNYIKEFYMTTK